MKKGFTLLELIIVIIILAILASLALPRFIKTAERARAAEALAQLGALRGSMDRYWLPDRVYTGASMTNAADCGGAAFNLDVDCPNATAARLFDYALNVTAAQAYTITATRNAAKGGDGTSTITIQQDGTIVGTDVFAGIR